MDVLCVRRMLSSCSIPCSTDLPSLNSPFTVFGLIAAGGRSIAIRHSSGGVWVLASTPLCEEQKAKIAEIGEVRCVLVFYHGAETDALN